MVLSEARVVPERYNVDVCDKVTCLADGEPCPGVHVAWYTTDTELHPIIHRAMKLVFPAFKIACLECWISGSVERGTACANGDCELVTHSDSVSDSSESGLSECLTHPLQLNGT